MKAYAVTVEGLEVSVLVFTNTPGRAKSLALSQSPYLEGIPYAELSSRREKKADGLSDIEKVVLAECKEEQQLLRDLGWSQIDYGEYEGCEKCKKFSWELIPDSQTHLGICYECWSMLEKQSIALED